MAEYSGSCHCGAIHFTFEGEPIERGLRCNCSICIRKGATMAPYFVPPENMHIDAEPEVMSTYTFGTHIAKHHFCSRCGIYAFHEAMRKPGHFRVNLGCVEGLDAPNLPFDVFDGTAL